jgi:hypothetical protein
MEDFDWEVINFKCDLDEILLHSEDLIFFVPTIICQLIINKQGSDSCKGDGKQKSHNDKNPGGGKNAELNNAVTRSMQTGSFALTKAMPRSLESTLTPS